jgi:phosphopantothenoylcysteine decarboxylase/phosphopantothenate--cysteine ligase
MWENPSTQENLRALSARGYRVVPPESGDLACGYEATGRMAEPETILAAVEGLLASPWRGVRVLVSAGGTEEDIDPVRVIRNRSTGRMGFAMAEAARDLGAEVTVVAANAAVPEPHGLRVVRVRTGEEMARALRDAYAACDVLVMAAAVSDFRPATPLAGKRPSGGEWTLALAPTPDILAGLAEHKGARLLIGFALETEDVEARALAKLRRKHLDLIVVNNPLTAGAAFAYETNVVTVYDETGARYESAVPESKREIARRVLALAQTHASFRGRAQGRP